MRIRTPYVDWTNQSPFKVFVLKICMLTLGEYKVLETGKLCLGPSLIIDMRNFSRSKQMVYFGISFYTYFKRRIRVMRRHIQGIYLDTDFTQFRYSVQLQPLVG